MITVKVDTTAFAAMSKRIGKGIDRAVMLALNDTAEDLAKIEAQTAMQTLDRPTPFTLRGFWTKRATLGKLQSAVYIAPIQAAYLRYQVDGGTVSKRKPVPSKGRENQYGNLPRNATKSKRVYHIKSRGNDLTFIRTGKRASKLLATWSNARAYGKRFPFYQRAESRVPAYFPRVFLKHIKTVWTR
jgi:hypothetical protein